MGCKLTVAGKEFVGGLIFVSIAVALMMGICFVLGWTQLHVFNMNMIPEAPIGSEFMYYIVTGGTILGYAGALLVLAAFVVVVFMHALPKLFTCKKEEQ